MVYGVQLKRQLIGMQLVSLVNETLLVNSAYQLELSQLIADSQSTWSLLDDVIAS